MKPILVLGPAQPGAPALERGQVDLCRPAPGAEVVAADGGYDTVIVVNDGDADTLRRLRLALEMRGRGGELSVAVLTYLEAPALDAADAPPVDWLVLWPHLRIELNGAVLSLEYQAD